MLPPSDSVTKTTSLDLLRILESFILVNRLSKITINFNPIQYIASNPQRLNLQVNVRQSITDLSSSYCLFHQAVTFRSKLTLFKWAHFF